MTPALIAMFACAAGLWIGVCVLMYAWMRVAPISTSAIKREWDHLNDIYPNGL